MTFDQIEELKFYIRNKVRCDKIAASNSRLNGYLAVALGHDNEAAFGEKVLRSLQGEKGVPDYAQQKADY